MNIKNKYIKKQMKQSFLSIILLFGIVWSLFAKLPSKNLPDPYALDFVAYSSVALDTIPLEDRKGDYITDKKYNPFDITPTEIKQKVEYDPETGHYVIMEKIGDEYYRTPSYMTFDEYMDYIGGEQEKQYFNTLGGIKSNKKSKSGRIDPMDKIDLQNSLIDRLFGGTEVNIQPQGSVALSVGWLYSRREDPNLQLNAQRQSQPDFPTPLIKMNVDGKIGKKLNLDFNYDTQSTFDFDRLTKISFDSDAFSEDDIIKKIEAGNVSLPLRGNLIQGAQSLFGIKTELQFGRLRLTGLLSYQRSKSNNIKIENGVSVQEFNIAPNEYDENRHFFLGHYYRDSYEINLENLPYIGTSHQIAQIEVWVSDDRPEFQENSTMVAAIADLAEPDRTKFTGIDANTIINNNTDTDDSKDVRKLPYNDVNDIYKKLSDAGQIEDIDKVSKQLQSSAFNLKRTRDFEVFRGRKLSSSEYSYNPKLGTLSLNAKLKPNQVLGVAYNYYFTSNGNKIYQVGQIAANSIQPGDQTDTTRVEPAKVHFVKLLKSTNQTTTSPMWDLMMKNVYNLRISSLNQQDFVFDVFYEDDLSDGSLKRYIPDSIPQNELSYIPLLQLFNLDRLNRVGDPQPDGYFDYIPGVTVIERTGSVVFPVLEPFNAHISAANIRKIRENSNVTDKFLEKFKYDLLYDTSYVAATQLGQLKNKFRMVGKVKGSAANGEIYLGAFVPQGSVRVNAGGKSLVEGQDYEIDYSIGRLKIINPAYLAQGTPINVSFEDNSIFNLQQKSMQGLRAEYQFNKKSSLGFTFLRLAERPITQKVNIGDDPINNKIFGLDYNFSNDAPWLTKLVDKLPFYSTAEKSTINFTAEVAGIKPGHASGINFNYLDVNNNEIIEDSGIANLDDFEGAITNLNLGGFSTNQWSLASVPIVRKEYELDDNLAYNSNRALLNWSTVDLGAVRSPSDLTNPYTRLIQQQELFKNRDRQPGNQQLFTFDISYYPEKRGPYNFDTKGGYPGISEGINVINNEKIELREPKTRWAGIQRYFTNSDFEAANYEAIEFWMLNPFMDRGDGQGHAADEEGKIVFNLGSVSEDVMKDNLLFFENAMPTTQRKVPVTNTAFGKATVSIPLVNGFDLQEAKIQDVGFDGLNNAQEFDKFQSWLIGNNLTTIQEIANDPSNDDFVFFNDQKLINEPSLLDRMRFFNGPEGNAPLDNGNINTSGANGSTNLVRGNRYPDIEDINNNKSLDQTEAYYEYMLTIKRLSGTNELDTAALGSYFRQSVSVFPSGGGKEEIWYKIQIPINSGKAINGISGYRSIQYMRMYMTEFEKPKTFRLADFQLQRSIWRKQKPLCVPTMPDQVFNKTTYFSIDDVGIEENGDKKPFNYSTPAGAIRNRAFNQVAQYRQDERSMALKFKEFEPGCEVSISKTANLNLALYKRLQMFVHAENIANLVKDSIRDGDLSIIVRLGKDFPLDTIVNSIQNNNNYYEYELPLHISKGTDQSGANVWKKANNVDIPLDSLLALRRFRISNNIKPREQIVEMPINEAKGDMVRMVGNPSLGAVKVILIGVKNRANHVVDGEVWVNELRVTGYDESFAWAAQSRLQVQMADLGELNFAGNFSSNGFGGIDKRLHERSREEKLQYDITANIDAGKLLPKALKLSVPVYAQYQKTRITPQYDPIDKDIKVKDKLALIKDSHKRDSIQELAQVDVIIKTFNLTNVKVNAGGTGKPWSPSNFSVSYAFTENTYKDAILLEDKTTTRSLGLDYIFARKSSYIEPFKFIKVKALKFISDFNFSILPSNFSFTSRMNDLTNRRTFRQPIDPIFAFDDNRFTWERNYVLDWDFAKSLRFGYRASSNSIVDQLRYVGVANTLDGRDLVDQTNSIYDENGVEYRQIVKEMGGDPNYYRNKNLRSLGRSKNYQHTASLNYKLPFKSIPILDWLSAGADYKADYAWDAGSLIKIDDEGTLLGNSIRNGQNASFNVTFDFTKLYSKFGYLKSIETGKASRSASKKSASDTKRKMTVGKDGVSPADAKLDMADGENPENEDKSKNKKDKKEDKPRDPSMAERIILRPLMLLRSIKFNYKDDRTTQIPGFMPQSKLLGQSEGFTAPGWDFIAGVQPRITGDNNWLVRNQDWFNPSTKFNDGLIQTKKQTFDAKILIEPFKDFSIDVTFKKNYQESHNEVFRKTATSGGQFQQLARFDVGSYDATFFSLNTLFGNSFGLYEEFKSNREIISRRLPNVPNPGLHPTDPAYPTGYGPLHNSVTIPAFMAAYTKTSAFDISLDQQKLFASNTYIPKPNWQLNYNGLSKLSMFKKYFSNITIKHGYSNTLRVSRFETSPLFDANNPFGQLSPNDNYYSRLEMPSVSIQEQFVPVLGLSVKTLKDMKFDLDFKMTRGLELGTINLRETKSKEITIGAGYVVKNFKAFSKKKKAKKKSSKKKAGEEDETDTKKDSGLLSKLMNNKGTAAAGRDVRINFAYSYKDDLSQIYNLQSGISGQADRGQKTITLNPSIEYDVNKNLALRFYFDYARTVPKTTLSYPTTTIRSGITLKFNIN